MRAFITAVLLLSVTALVYGEDATTQAPTPTAEPSSTKTLTKQNSASEPAQTPVSTEKDKGTQTTDAKTKVTGTDKSKAAKGDKADPTMSVRKGSLHKHQPMNDEPAKASNAKNKDVPKATPKSKLAGKASVNTSDSTKEHPATVTDPPGTKGSGLSPLPNYRLVSVVVAMLTVILNLL
ncbi:uncharacterized protein [Haliotis asinina]|uniref:uncharacterized protein n=1 Tax=Haliotis asinina TaxID=109174 RepID=UPI003531FBE8